MKVRFEADIDDSVMAELDFWGLRMEDVVRESVEHSILGAIRRKTDHLCRKCRKPLLSSVPLNERTSKKHYKGFCDCT
jgi:hypothetical protein